MTRQSADLPPAPGRRSRSEIARFMPWSMEPHNTLLHWLYGCDMGLIPNLLGIRVTHSRESYQPTTIMRLDRGVEWVNSSDFSRSVAACNIPVVQCLTASKFFDFYPTYCQWPFQEPKLEVPTIYKAYFSGLDFKEYPHCSLPSS